MVDFLEQINSICEILSDDVSITPSDIGKALLKSTLSMSLIPVFVNPSIWTPKLLDSFGMPVLVVKLGNPKCDRAIGLLGGVRFQTICAETEQEVNYKVNQVLQEHGWL